MNTCKNCQTALDFTLCHHDDVMALAYSLGHECPYFAPSHSATPPCSSGNDADEGRDSTPKSGGVNQLNEKIGIYGKKCPKCDKWYLNDHKDSNGTLTTRSCRYCDYRESFTDSPT